MTQASLFDIAEARRRRDEALARVDAGADDGWKGRALNAIYQLACHYETFCAEDAWASGLEKPREPRAMGPVMRLAVKLGYCIPTDQYRPSRMATQHATPIRVYRSLIRRPQ